MLVCYVLLNVLNFLFVGRGGLPPRSCRKPRAVGEYVYVYVYIYIYIYM